MGITVKKGNFLVILCGLPSSGKTTYASELKTHLAESCFSSNNADVQKAEDVKIVDVDEIRIREYGPDFFPKYESSVRTRALKTVSVHLDDDEIVIVDDLNYYASMRQEFRKLARERNRSYFIIWISTPLEVCLEWNKKRGAKIPGKLIRDIADKFDEPGSKYSWDKPFLEFDLSKIPLNDAIANTCRSISNVIKTRDTRKEPKESSGFAPSYLNIVDYVTRRIIHILALSLSANELILDQNDEIASLIEQNNDLKACFDQILIKNNDIEELSRLRRSFLKMPGLKTENLGEKTVIKLFCEFLNEF